MLKPVRFISRDPPAQEGWALALAVIVGSSAGQRGEVKESATSMLFALLRLAL